MKTFTYILALVIIGAGIWWWGGKSPAMEPMVQNEKEEFCFAKFAESVDSEFMDKYTLRMVLEGEKVSGELKLLPAESDSLIGEFTGTATAAGDAGTPRAANLFWDTEGEGMSIKQELKIIWDAEQASVGLGEMVDRGDGVYIYKDPAQINYSLGLSTIACAELNERESVEKYLRENIVTLSPVAPVLGGNWYVVEVAVDLAQNTGTVTYEDGHIQEKREFIYTTNAQGEIATLTVN